MIIIGITGTLGSGKGTVVRYLIDKYGFKHFSGPAYIREEVAKRGLPDNRDSMFIVGNNLRATFGPGYIAEHIYEQGVQAGGHAVLESLRSPGEITTLRSKSNPIYILAVDADPKIRYERVIKRGSYKDNITFEKFLSDEEKEMNDPDPAGMNIAACIKMADGIVLNNSGFHSFHSAIDAIVKSLMKS